MPPHCQNCSKNSCGPNRASPCDRKDSNGEISSGRPHDSLTLSECGQLRQPFPCCDGMPTLWLLSTLAKADGHIYVHRSQSNLRNLRGDNGIEPSKSISNEMPVTDNQRNVLMMENRTWHTTAANQGNTRKVGVLVSNAPSQLNAELVRQNRTTVPDDFFNTFSQAEKPLCQLLCEGRQPSFLGPPLPHT